MTGSSCDIDAFTQHDNYHNETLSRIRPLHPLPLLPLLLASPSPSPQHLFLSASAVFSLPQLPFLFSPLLSFSTSLLSFSSTLAHARHLSAPMFPSFLPLVHPPCNASSTQLFPSPLPLSCPLSPTLPLSPLLLSCLPHLLRSRVPLASPAHVFSSPLPLSSPPQTALIPLRLIRGIFERWVAFLYF